jgi:hypothetical protein
MVGRQVERRRDLPAVLAGDAVQDHREARVVAEVRFDAAMTGPGAF